MVYHAGLIQAEQAHDILTIALVDLCVQTSAKFYLGREKPVSQPVNVVYQNINVGSVVSRLQVLFWELALAIDVVDK